MGGREVIPIDTRRPGKLCGHGVGYRPPHYSWIFENRPRVDFFEIISENFLHPGARPRRFLEKLREDYPIAAHGVSLSIGSTEPVREEYLFRLKALIDWLEPAVVSDHLCWTRHGGINSHDLLPLSRTQATLTRLIEQVSRVQDRLKRPILLENASAYVEFSGSEMTEPELLTALCAATGCGILLDINNVYVNSRNLGCDARDYLSALPAAAVGQFHLAGHTRQGHVLVDTHDQPVPTEVMDLYSEAVRLWPEVPTLIEWDAMIPEFPRLQAEADRARQVHEASLAFHAQTARHERQESKFQKGSEKPDSHFGFLQAMTRPDPPDRLESFLRTDLPVSAFDGFEVYHQGYFLRLKDSLADTFPALSHVLEDDGFSELVASYLSAHAPDGDSIDEAGKYLARHLVETGEKSGFGDYGVPAEALADLAALEWARALVFRSENPKSRLTPETLRKLSPEQWARMSIRLSPDVILLRSRWRVGPACASVEEGKDPLRPEGPGDFTFVVARNSNGKPTHRELDPFEARFMDELSRGRGLAATDPTDYERAARCLLSWAENGWILETREFV